MLAAPPIPSITPEPPPTSQSQGQRQAQSASNISLSVTDGSLADTGYLSESTLGLRAPAHKQHISQPQKFPHTRAQLAAIARDYHFRRLMPNANSGGRGGPASASSESDVEDGWGGGGSRWEDDYEARVSSSLVRQVAALLDEEKEDELKELLKSTFEMDDDATETPVLDLMHAHKDDTSGVPFLFLTPTRRPISRPSSRASSHSFRLAPGPPRPDTPTSTVSAPSSPSLLGPIRRPHTPATSPLAAAHSAASSYMTLGNNNSSPSLSPTLAHAHAHVTTMYLATSLPASPLSSPRLLNAKAHEFRPTPRPLSAASSNPGTSTSMLSGRRAETPSPDLWAHGSGALRSMSKLAIASPLIPDNTLLPPGTPPRAHTPTSPLRNSSLHADIEHEREDEDEDPFDPFAPKKTKTAPRSFHPVQTAASPPDFDTGLSNSSASNSSLSEEGALWGGYPHISADNNNMYSEFDASGDSMAYGPGSYFPEQYPTHQGLGGGSNMGMDNGGLDSSEYDPETAAALTDGMTPFDVLSSVFGATLAPSELEEALAVNGYEFERAMQWLVDRARPAPSPPGARMQQQGQGGYAYGGSGGVHVIPRQAGVVLRGGRAGFGGGPGMAGPGGRGAGRYGNGNGRPPQGGNRVCRYFLAGECMRADCRFSHDLDRALCRFWLRGTCAKGESCEFLHHLPNEVDVQSVQSAMAPHQQQHGMDMGEHMAGSPPPDDFPTLSQENMRGGARRGFQHYGSGNGSSRGYAQQQDPGRTRFAAAVKKAPTPAFVGAAPPTGLAAQMAGRREAKAVVGDSVYSRPTVVAPRASPRLKLRVPALLPTLPTGEAVNALYMAYRSRALQLGAARNACLSRAADAWRRGDGAAAKRFSREGHELNAKMGAEAAEAAGKLVRERARLAENAVRTRDPSWSDDPGDRSSRGKACGGGLGVCLGVASTSVYDEATKLTQEERTEVVLDLHGLHSNEATEVLEDFLLSLEREHFFGLAFLVVGEEKHTGTQDAARGASRGRLATGIREWLHNWGYPWNERDGIICVDPLTHMQ